jgi:hypothetical protein
VSWRKVSFSLSQATHLFLVFIPLCSAIFPVRSSCLVLEVSVSQSYSSIRMWAAKRVDGTERSSRLREMRL